MELLWTIIAGFVIGLPARFLMPGRDPAGFILTVVIGIAGAFTGAYAGRAMNLYGPNEAAGFAASVLGAMLLLFLYSIFFARRDITTET